MAFYEVSVQGKVVETFEASDYASNGDQFTFFDDNNSSVGSIVKAPGMSVKKVDKTGQRRVIG